MSHACWLPWQPYPRVVGRGADGQPSLRAVDSSCQAQLLEIWVTLSKNRLLPWSDGLPLHCTVRAGWCSACSGRRSLTYLAHRPVSWENGGCGRALFCGLNWSLEPHWVLAVRDVRFLCVFPWESHCCFWALHLADDSREDSNLFFVHVAFFRQFLTISLDFECKLSSFILVLFTW